MDHPVSSYCQERLSLLQISNEENCLLITDENGKRVPFFMFSPTPSDDIRINYLTPNGLPLSFEKGRWRKETPYYVTRLKEPRGDMKYQNPTNTPVQIFIPPQLINKTSIETLYVIEGQFKAMAGAKAGLDIVGISGIWGFREKKIMLHSSIMQLVKERDVQKLVLLYDADWRKSSYDPLDPDKDLAKRLYSFHGAADAFKNCVLPLGLSAGLAAIKEDFNDMGTKGLDDLLIEEDYDPEVVEDLEKGNQFFDLFDLSSFDKNSFKALFYLDSADAFYKQFESHLDDNEFCYRGRIYKYDREKGKLIQTNGEINPDKVPYRWIGTTLYKIQEQPWPGGLIRQRLTPWSIDMVKRQHGPKIMSSIPVYEGFTILPDNIKYRRVVGGYYNKYEPVSHQAEEGETKTTEKFLKHIFGKQYQLGLDYLQLLYTMPIERLPILALISKERKTGKSTFLNWLKAVYPLQMAIYKNEELKAKFNNDWAGKLVIAVDEATMSLDKEATESFKYWNFAKSIFSEAKGKDRIEVPFFAKFILTSNDETNFLSIDDAEDRFWVIKVHSFKGKENTDLLDDMIKEIPAFLHMLLHRELKSKKKTRMWFTPAQIQTDALMRVKEKSRSTVEKEIREIIRDAFFDFLPEIQKTYKESCIRFTRDDIHQKLLSQGTRAFKSEISDILKEGWGMQNNLNKRYKTYSWSIIPEDNDSLDEVLIKHRKGRFFTFEAQNFLSEEELNNLINNNP
ncbi:MAG: DUF5906 domain-containing protein [Bacteroidia bacterium]|nr:DUF5906 domain-containing protein [Bacteroidia bacterium]